MLTSDHARSMLAECGRAVDYVAETGEAVPTRAVVTVFGFGSAPSGFDADLFDGLGYHASFRLAVSDHPEPPVYGDEIAFETRLYEIRQVDALPRTSTPIWWRLRCVAEQRGSSPA